MSEEEIKIVNKVEQKYNELLKKNNKILVISKEGCPNCDKLKEMFNVLDIPYNTFLYKNENKLDEDFKEYLKEQTKGKFFPFCFVNSKYIGGYKEVQMLFSTEKMKELLLEIDIEYEEDF
jgi:glutaredoxin